jgi:RNA polymerase sigma-70 factor (ECF subfamily)
VEQDGLSALVAAAQTGGSGEADRLIEAVWPRAFRIAYSVLHDHSLAEDAAQEACAIVFREVRRLRSAAAFGVWFYRIVVRETAELERRRSRCSELPDTATTEPEPALMRIDVANALAALSAAQRTCIALHFYAEMNSREIAAVLGIPDSSVRFHIMKGKQLLRKALESERTGAA